MGTDNLSPNLPQRRNLLFRQGGVEGVGKKKSIAVEGSAAGTEGAQRGGLGGEGMAGAPLGAGTGGKHQGRMPVERILCAAARATRRQGGQVTGHRNHFCGSSGPSTAAGSDNHNSLAWPARARHRCIGRRGSRSVYPAVKPQTAH